MHLTLAQPVGGGISFEAYAPDQAALFGTDQKMTPMGRGTPLGGIPGADLNWEGHLPNGGVIYILVKNTSQSPVQLNFTSCALGNQFEMVYIPPEPCPTGLFGMFMGCVQLRGPVRPRWFLMAIMDARLCPAPHHLFRMAWVGAKDQMPPFAQTQPAIPSGSLVWFVS